MNTTDIKENISDAWITTKIKAALLVGKNASGMDTEVETRDGIVRLSGGLPNQESINNAISIARGIEGVKGVDASALHVDPA